MCAAAAFERPSYAAFHADAISARLRPTPSRLGLIWSSTHAGLVNYASPEWTGYTGQPLDEALGEGWLAMLHPEDREATNRFFKEACASAAPFTVRYRLHRIDGAYAWVVSGATPSVSPVDGSFLGYLGSLSEVEASGWSGRLGSFEPQSPTPATSPHQPVDIIADHLLLARSVALANGEERLLASLDFALSEVMRRLGYPSGGIAKH